MMLAHIGKKDLLKSKEYLFEPKLDGYRALCTKSGSRITFTSRNGLDMTSEFPELQFILKKDCVIDGEIVMFDAKGNPSFSMMQRRSLESKHHASYVAFDILELEGKSVKDLKLSKRKELLESVVEPDSHIQIVPSTNDGEKLWKMVKDRNLEGVMAKKIDSKYTDGRSREWLKIKNELTADCIIIGYKTKVRKIASLALGLFLDKEIRYIGQVGTGFTEKFLDELEKKLKPFKDSNNIIDLPKDVVSVQPEHVCEVKYLELTKDIRLRAPVFIRIRTDKPKEECSMTQVIINA